MLRWQLCEADLPAGEDLPYSAAWTRAQLLQVLTEFFAETEAGRGRACRRQVKSRPWPRFAPPLERTLTPWRST